MYNKLLTLICFVLLFLNCKINTNANVTLLDITIKLKLEPELSTLSEILTQTFYSMLMGKFLN